MASNDNTDFPSLPCGKIKSLVIVLIQSGILEGFPLNSSKFPFQKWWN